MRIPALLEQWLLERVDQWAARRPQRRPPLKQLAAARIVAHRGVYDNHRIFENTLAAFERFRAAGGWGIELDVRWTRDGVPVVSHDPDGRRVFGVHGLIAAMDLATLQRSLPLVPTLAAVIDRFGGQLHLMVEIKFEGVPDMARQREILQQHFATLTPGRDYHLLSLNPDLLCRFGFSPSQAGVPIAQMNLREVNRAAQANAWGGIAGHYALIGRRHIELLHRRGCQVGTGYINSRNSFYREVARGVDWLFSDQALALQKIITHDSRMTSQDNGHQ
jgi:glycerophosphoryl diester phosphodiesterase